MAYIMKGYTYPGESPVKAKKQLQSVSNPDKTLTAAGKALGSSYIPMAVDFNITRSGIDIEDVRDEIAKSKKKDNLPSVNERNPDKKKKKSSKKGGVTPTKEDIEFMEKNRTGVGGEVIVTPKSAKKKKPWWKRK
tara:strand:+ start:150 stop:554 length:405 start_codon:yes stop_codon:yes gene_type:complete